MSGDLAQLRTMLTGFPGAGLVLSAEARVLWANAEAHRCFGEGDLRTEITYRPVAEVLPCDLGTRLTRIVEAARDAGAGMSQRFRVEIDSDAEDPPCSDVTIWPVPRPGAPLLWIVQILEVAPRLGRECGVMPGALRCTASVSRKDVDVLRDRAVERADILRISTENSDVVPWYRFPERGVGRISPHLSAMLGYPADFHIDLPVLNGLIHPEDLPRVSGEFHALLAGTIESFCHDFRVRRADGAWTWITSRGRLVDRAERALPKMICGTLTDISERKAQEARLAEALAEAEAARTAAQATADALTTALICGETAVWSICAELGEAWMPDECYRQLGYEPGEFVPDDAGWRSLFHPDDLRAAIAKMEDLVLDRTTVFSSDHRLRHKDGSYHWYHTIARKIDRSDRGLPFLVSGGFTRIDEAKAIEAQLSAALEEAQQLRDRAEERGELLRTSGLFAGVGHFSVCPELNEGWTPDETYRLFGCEPGAFPASEAGWRSRIHPDDLAGAITAMERLKAGEADIYEHEHRSLHADGTYHWYRAIARRVDRAAKGLPYLLAGAIISIDPSKENERRLAEEADKANKARARLDTLADNAPGALFEYRRNADGSIDMPYFSAKLPMLLGVARAAVEARGEMVFQNVPRETCAKLLEQIERSRSDGTPFEARFPVDHPELGRRWLTVSSLPYPQDDGSTLWFGTLFDVTEQVRMMQQAERSAEEVRRAHDRMVTMAENSPGAIFEWQREPGGHFKFNFVSAALPELLGVTREDLETDGACVFTHIPDEDIPQVHTAVQRSIETLTRFEILHRITHQDRGLRWLHVSASPFPQENGAIIWYGNAMDVTERMEAKRREEQVAEAMHQVHERLASIASIAPVGLYEFRRGPDDSTSFPYASPYLEDLLGVGYGVFTRAASVEYLFANVDPADLPEFMTAKGDKATNLELWNQRFRVRHPTRGEIWLANSATPKQQPDGSVVWTGALHDVTADVEREAELRLAHRMAEDMRAENERQALHDGLTGLPNRRCYDQVLARRIAAAEATGPRECVLIRIDLDHFKHVNDTLGHEAGDMVLQRVADVLREELRGADFASRIGGDEFSVLLAPGQTGNHAREIVERMQLRLAEPLMFDGRQCRFGASFGIAETEDIAAMGAEIQLFADAALYRAKEGGRNRMEFFTPELHQNILFDRKLAVEIQEGLDRGEFVPFFQSQVSSADGTLTGVETLLRWRHPERGLLAPDAFMHVAEQLRLVPEIDRVMMEKSRESLAFWRAQGVFVPKISFNVSAGRMHDPDVVRAARSIAADETKVTFELLESILVEEESEVFRFHLDAIRDAGIEIEIDDFGSGHASIIGLMQIAPSGLKIDQRIVAPVARDQRSRNLVRAIVEIAETLGIATVAEGVETRAQADILRDLGCDVLQGYLFSMPLSAEDFARMCRQEARRA